MPGAREDKHRFDLDGGTVALDFVNTVSGIRGIDPRERLAGYPDVVYWAGQVGLIDSQRAAAAFGEAIRRREALHDVVLSAIEGRAAPDAGLEIVNAWIADALARRRFRVAAPGRFEVALEEDGDLLSFLRPVALDAAELLEDEVSRDLVGICEERLVGRCAWLFVDTSRNHSRRFCNMQDCGNRAKQRRHYRRGKSSPRER
jgi:predicted RNA-binding Zn ribbon-like protein